MVMWSLGMKDEGAQVAGPEAGERWFWYRRTPSHEGAARTGTADATPAGGDSKTPRSQPPIKHHGAAQRGWESVSRP